MLEEAAARGTLAITSLAEESRPPAATGGDRALTASAEAAPRVGNRPSTPIDTVGFGMTRAWFG